MGHNHGRDNVRKRAARRKKTERLALAKKKQKPANTAEIENPKSEEKAASLKRGGNFLVVFSRAKFSSPYLI